MKYIALPPIGVQRLSFYLAMEEYVARHLQEEGDCFFMWQVEPSVIFGRNQLIENEVNMDYCRAHHIQTYRRKSGGGCVYADMSNIMFSYITHDENVNFTFNRYINMVVLVLQQLGVNASTSGRNDVMIGNRKVSGNAFYHIPGRSIVHGTMLYDTNMQNMVGSITPTGKKLLSKGISSVRQRIALLKDYIPQSLEEFKTFVRQRLCQDERLLDLHDVESIREIEKEYLSDEFIYGNNPRYSIVRRQHINNVGEIEVRMEIKNNIIKAANIMGDYFVVGDTDRGILLPLRGCELTHSALTQALPERMDHYIMNLQKENFIQLLLQESTA